jgi:hypothetical protein
MAGEFMSSTDMIFLTSPGDEVFEMREYMYYGVEIQIQKQINKTP